MSWFIKKSVPIQNTKEKHVTIPEGLWVRCSNCKEVMFREEMRKNLQVCPKCDHHGHLGSKERMEDIFDHAAYKPLFQDLKSSDPLNFEGLKKYSDQLKKLANKGKTEDAIKMAEGKVNGIQTIVGVMDFSFLGGSMGSVVGEKITLGIERAIEHKTPVIIFSCSGGARMMEGALSLMQMAKISAALARLSEHSLPFISILVNPTTGGVTASYAMLGDINISEPGALICFAGPRVIQQTIRQELPEGFQRAEFLLTHGMLDTIVPRSEMKQKIGKFIQFFAG